MAIKLIIFDLDGTLVDSIEGLGTAMNKVLETHGYPVHKIEDYKNFVGSGIRKLVMRSLPLEHRHPEVVDLCYEEMLKSYAKHYAVGMSLYKDIDIVLNELIAKDIKFAINTNKNHEMAEKVAERFLGDWPFVKVIGASEKYEIKPSPKGALHIAKSVNVKPSECVYIGDSEVDLLTANNAGMHAILVTWGFRTEEQLLILNPEVLVRKPLEILEQLENIQ